MYSFYGGKQGRTYNLVQRYDEVYIDQTALDTFQDGASYEFGSRFTYESKIYLVLPQNQEGTTEIVLTVDDLKDDEKVAEIKGMVNEFQKGGAYTDTNYGQYVIIDTILNENHKNDDLNGLIYRRGFDYTEPVVSYKRPEKGDQEIRTIKSKDGQRTYTGLLNIYHDYDVTLSGQPNDLGFNDDRWVAAWRKYVLKPGGGAIYVGQIVGPQGDTPELKGLSWEEFVELNTQAGDQVTHGIVEMTNTLGWTGEEYNDNIKLGYCNIQDKDGNITGCFISFDIPKTVIKVSAQSVDAYGKNARTHKDDASNVTDSNIKITTQHTAGSPTWTYSNLIHQHSKTGAEAGHPFYLNYDIAVPNGIHGQDVTEMKVKTGSQIGTGSDYEGNPIVSNDQYITYTTTNYNDTATGKTTVNLGKWPYRVIRQITTNLKQRTYFNNWGYNVGVGELYPLIPNDSIYGICVKAGTTGAAITIDPEDYNLGDEVGSGDTLWRVISLPQTTAANSITVDYKAGQNDTLTGIRTLDYLAIDDNGNIYANYSDVAEPSLLGTIGSIRDVNFDTETSNFVVIFHDGREYAFALNYVLSVGRKGDNVIVFYSDKNYRDNLRNTGVIDKDYYLIDYTDPITGIEYTGQNAVWQNLGTIGAQYHIQGEYKIQDLKTGSLKDGFVGALADRAGWLVSVKEGNAISLYAYDYNLENSHTWPDGTPTRWYKLKDFSSDAMLPELNVRLSSESAGDTYWQEDQLNENGLWFVVSVGHD